MSSTMRLFINDNRISTAVKVKTGAILQVYPSKTTFTDEVAWRAYWDQAMKPKIILRIGDAEERVVTPAPVPAPAQQPPKPKKASLDDWNVTKKRNFTHTLPAGTYYIGDLCYVLGDNVYYNIFGGTGFASGIYEEKGTGRSFLVASTAWGDGEYEGSDGKKFGVDAGIIGICSQSLMAKDDGGGHLYTFESPVKCRFIAGLFAFEWTSGWNYNSLRINTE